MTSTDLLEGLRAHRNDVASLDVVHADERSTSPVPIRPEDLEERNYVYKDHTTDAALIRRALDVVEASRPEPDRHEPELRWKMTFRDAGGAPLLELWHHSYEGYGRIGTQRVKFKDTSILNFLRENFDKGE
jgi:hypothetical protein